MVLEIHKDVLGCQILFYFGHAECEVHVPYWYAGRGQQERRKLAGFNNLFNLERELLLVQFSDILLKKKKGLAVLESSSLNSIPEFYFVFLRSK